MTRSTRATVAACGLAFVCCLATGGAVREALAQQSLSYAELVGRLIDMQAPARLPLAGERNAMWASTDRASRFDAATGKYVAWEANGDGNGFIRKEGDSLVLAEMEGPGVIWRIWSAMPKEGRVKIFLDGAETPAIDMPFAHYFDAAHEPFALATLGYESGRGKNLYFPIPYQRSCKIVAEEGWGRYFQFTYTTFPPETRLPTFSTALAEEPIAAAALRRVDRFFAEGLGTDPAGERTGQVVDAAKLDLPAGQTVQAARLQGPRAISALRVKMDFADRADQMAALRGIVLKITWDNDKTPAVWCPLGDFFGTAPGENHFTSLPVGMTADGYYSYWFMPFDTSALVELVNDTPVDRQLQMELIHAPLAAPVERWGRLHVKWHRDVMPVSKDRYPDWTLLRTQGRGRFCGVMLHVWNPRGGQYAPAGVGRYWWGEGDEKFFVDGEVFPSTFGTGTEDYFGYAWGCGDYFSRPFNCQSMTEQNAGHQSVCRWQIADNVPFAKSFDGYLEKYFPNEVPTLFACTTVWYLAPGGVDPHGPVPAAERWGYCVRPPTVAGGYLVLERSGGAVSTQDMRSFGQGVWSGDDQLWWTGGKPGDRLDVELPVKKAGKYALSVRLTKAADYGIVQPFLDGKKVGPEIDLYNDGVILTEPIRLGTAELAEGPHRLSFEIVGANAQAIKKYMFGLDRVVLEPVE